MWIQPTGLVFAPTHSQIKVTLVVCLTFALRGFLLRIGLQRNSSIFLNSAASQRFAFNFAQMKIDYSSDFYLIWHHVKDGVRMASVCLWRWMWVILVCAQRLKSLWRVDKVGGFVHLASSGKNSVKCSFYLSRWEKKCCVAPLHREGLFPEEAILATLCQPPPHSSLTNVKKR